MPEQFESNDEQKYSELKLTDLIGNNIARILGVINRRIEQLAQQARTTHKEGIQRLLNRLIGLKNWLTDLNHSSYPELWEKTKASILGIVEKVTFEAWRILEGRSVTQAEAEKVFNEIVKIVQCTKNELELEPDWSPPRTNFGSSNESRIPTYKIIEGFIGNIKLSLQHIQTAPIYNPTRATIEHLLYDLKNIYLSYIALQAALNPDVVGAEMARIIWSDCGAKIRGTWELIVSSLEGRLNSTSFSSTSGMVKSIWINVTSGKILTDVLWESEGNEAQPSQANPAQSSTELSGQKLVVGFEIIEQDGVKTVMITFPKTSDNLTINLLPPQPHQKR